MLTKTTPTQIGKLLGSLLGLVLLFSAPLLTDVGGWLLAIYPRRVLGGDILRLVESIIVIITLSALTLAGFGIWRHFWKRLEDEVPRTYLYVIIGLGSLIFVIHLLWRLAQLTVGLGLREEPLILTFNLPPPLSLIPTLFWGLYYGIYFFGNLIISFIVLRYHWHGLKE